MKILTLIVAAAALQAGVAVAAESAPAPIRASNTLICRWEATQQSGIPVRICLTKHQWMQRSLYTQQWIREYQARSFVTK